MRDLMKCGSSAGAILHTFTACTTVLGGLTIAVKKRMTENSTCGGGTGGATGPVLIMKTSTAMTANSTWIIMTMDMTIGGTTGASAGIGTGLGCTSEAIGPGW